MCVIHLIRASLRLSSSRDHPKLVSALRAIYAAPTEQAAEQALDAFAASELGERYPAVVRTWRAAWPEFTPYLAFPSAIRTVVYSRTWSSRSTPGCGRRPVAAHWKEALNQFSLFFEDRLSVR